MERVVLKALAQALHRLVDNAIHLFSEIFQICRKLFCEVIQRSRDCDFLRITAPGSDFYFVFYSLSTTGSQNNFCVFQIFSGKSVSKENLFGQRHLVRFHRNHQLIAIGFVGVNTRLRFTGFFLQRDGVVSSGLSHRRERSTHQHQ